MIFFLMFIKLLYLYCVSVVYVFLFCTFFLYMMINFLFFGSVFNYFFVVFSGLSLNCGNCVVFYLLCLCMFMNIVLLLFVLLSMFLSVLMLMFVYGVLVVKVCVWGVVCVMMV